MQNTFFLILMYLSEWFIVYSYAKSIYEKRNMCTAFLTISLYAVLMISYIFLKQVEILNIVFTIICHILCLYIGFRSTIKSALFHGLFLAITQYISEATAVYIISWGAGSSNTSYKDNIVIYAIDVIVSKILFYLISRFLLRFSNKETNSKSWGRWFALSILPVSSMFLLIVMRILTNGQVFTIKENILCISSITVLLISNIVVYLIYEKSEKSNQKLIELELSNQKDFIDMQYLTLLEKKNEQMQIMTHDYKNNILTIAEMTDSPEIKEYINSMVGEIKKYNQIAKTKNRFLDVILSKYTDISENKGIRFEIDIMTDNLSFINTYDLSSLFNNILDNAVEAAETSKDSFISLTISNSLNAYHKITVINSCKTEPKSKDGKLVTTKSDSDAHGFGTKSIQKIVNKYNGELQWGFDEQNLEFKLVILFPERDINKNHKIN